MPLRETGERHAMIDKIVRPDKPKLGAPERHVRHHAVHTAICWMHELTDAPIEHLHDELAGYHKRKRRADSERLHDIATEALQCLGEMSDHFSAVDYASIYSHLQQGLITPTEG